MDIIKCSNCSREIHRYIEDHGKCPFCAAHIASDNKPTNSFDGLPPFLRKKLLKIDEYIGTKQTKEALSLIGDILEWMPGWEVGSTIPKTGEIYWRKLLAVANCKSDFELLHNEKSLRKFTAFNNAQKYANATEKPVYALIAQTENLIEEYLTNALNEQETAKKCKLIEDKVIDYKQRMIDLEISTQKYISALEKEEKSLRDQAIDCEIVAQEYIYALEVLSGEAKEIRDACASRVLPEGKINSGALPAQTPAQADMKQRAIDVFDKLSSMANGIIAENGIGAKKINAKPVFGISEIEKTKWEAQLDKIIVESNTELHTLQKLEATQEKTAHWRFLEYSLSLIKQKDTINEINRNKCELETLQSKATQLLTSIERISNKYNDAREAVTAGDYEPARSLLGVAFNDIVRRAMSDTKAGSL